MGPFKKLVVHLDTACISDWCLTDVFSVFRQRLKLMEIICRIGLTYMRAIGRFVATQCT